MSRHLNFHEIMSLVNERWIKVAGIDIGKKAGSITSNYNGHVKVKKFPEDEYGRAYEMGLSGAGVLYAEDVHTMPGQGIVSNGSLMEQKGFIKGYARGVKIRTEFITPLSWIECFTVKRTKQFTKLNGGPDTRAWKGHLAEIAKELAPDYLLDVINRDNADSFLIWFWAAHKELEQPMPVKGKHLFFK